MGILKKNFSSTGWETSDFGGFSRILWDLPEMTLPYGFHIKPSKDLSYLSYYSQRKLLSLFLMKADQLGYSEHLVQKATLEDKENRVFGVNTICSEYTFDKESIKQVLKVIISREVELKSLFINYSNALANSKILYEAYNYGLKEPTKVLDSENRGKILRQIKDVKEKRTSWTYTGSTVSGEKLKKLREAAKFKPYEPSAYDKKLIYDEEEIKSSDALLNLLDINFEKSESKISSLKVGKIDIPKLAEVLSGNSHIYFRKEEVEKTKPFSVCILCDESGSMDGSRINTQHSLVKILYKTFSQIMPDDKIYVYGHSGDETPEIYVYQDKFNPTFEESFANQLDHDFQQNYDGPVTDLIYEKIRSHTSDNILFIVISDGEPGGWHYGGDADNNDYKRVIEKCKRDGFVTCGIGIEYLSCKDLYQYSTLVKGYESTDAIKKVSMLINNVVKAEFQ